MQEFSESIKKSQEEINKKEQEEKTNDQESNVESDTSISKEEFEKLTNDYKDLKDKFLRSAAETENLRKIHQKEIQDIRKFTIINFAKELITVIEHISLGLAHIKEENLDQNSKQIHEGLKMSYLELTNLLKKFGIEEISSNIGDKFDPNLHDALSIARDENAPDNSILQVLRGGFKIYERVIKHVSVVVNKL